MPIATIQLPDGRIADVEVPQGATSQQIESFVMGQFQPQEQTSNIQEIARPALRAAKSSVAGLVGGAADLANLVAEAPIYAGYKAGQTIKGAITGEKQNQEYKPIFADKSVTEAINQKFDKVTGGLTTNRNRGEQLLEIPQEIAGSIAAPAAISKAINATTNLTKVGSKYLAQKAAGITPESLAILKAFEDAGINPTLANISQGQTTKTFQNLLGNFPGSRGVIEKATQDQVDNIAKQITGITKSEGGTAQQTGKIIQDAGKSVNSVLQKRTEKLYENLNKYIPEGLAVKPNNLLNLAERPEIQDVMAVGEGQTSKIINQLKSIIDDEQNISYDRLRIFRSTVGKKLQSGNLGGDERGAIKQIYGALSEDLKSAVVNRGGERALQDFNKANNAFKRYNDVLDSKINPLIDAKTPEAVYAMALSGSKQGGSNIRPLMKSLAPEQREFVRGSVAKKMGLANVGEQDAAGEVFSPAKFLTEWNKLSPEARANIFNKDQVSAIQNLNKTIFAIKNTQKARQMSNNLPYGLWAGLGYLARGSVINAGAAVGAANITAQMMTNPKFIKWLSQAPKVPPSEIPKHLKSLSAIASQNPNLREDILDYLSSITQENNQDQAPVN